MEPMKKRIERQKPGKERNPFTFWVFSDSTYSNILAILSQSWGGRDDAILTRLGRILDLNFRDFQHIRDRYVKAIGKPKDGGFSIDDAAPEDILEFNEAMEELCNEPIDLQGIELPIKLIKRKKTNLSPLQAAIAADFFEVKWPEGEDGSELDKP